MQKLLVIITVPLISLSATFILLFFLVPVKNTAPITVNAEPTHAIHAVKPATVIPVPMEIKVESISVSTVVNPVGLNQVGNMDIDDNPEQVAWYKLGPKPGEEGSAVIAGHYGWKDKVASVFNNLHTLVKGDEVSTIGEDGQIFTFVVTRTALYSPDQDATDVFKSDDGKAHLNLITCQGAWVNSAQSYSERLVVFTDLVE